MDLAKINTHKHHVLGQLLRMLVMGFVYPFLKFVGVNAFGILWSLCGIQMDLARSQIAFGAAFLTICSLSGIWHANCGQMHSMNDYLQSN